MERTAIAQLLIFRENYLKLHTGWAQMLYVTTDNGQHTGCLFSMQEKHLLNSYSAVQRDLIGTKLAAARTSNYKFGQTEKFCIWHNLALLPWWETCSPKASTTLRSCTVHSLQKKLSRATFPSKRNSFHTSVSFSIIAMLTKIWQTQTINLCALPNATLRHAQLTSIP